MSDSLISGLPAHSGAVSPTARFPLQRAEVAFAEHATLNQIAGGIVAGDYVPPITNGDERTIGSKLVETPSVVDFGADATGASDASTAITYANTHGPVLFPAGVFRVSTSFTLTSRVTFAPGASLSLDSGVVVTFSGEVHAPETQHIFTGLGTVVLSGQRAPVYIEWWGAVGNSVVNCAAAAQRAHDALTNGGTIQLLRGLYRWEQTVNFTNTVHLRGLGRGYNPAVGGSVIVPTSGMATNATPQVLLKQSTGSLCWSDFMVLGFSTTSRTQNYIAIQLVAGSGKCDLRNIEIIGCGVGFDLVAGNVGTFFACHVYAYTSAGYRFGGSAGIFSGPWRITSSVVNNADVTMLTTAETTSGAVLTVASTAGLSVGMGVVGYNIPQGTTIAALTSTTITMSASVAATVANNSYIRVGWNAGQGRGFHFLGNAFDIYLTDVEQAGGLYMADIVGSPGLPVPNAIFFQSSNFTATAYNGVAVRRGINIQFGANCWFGDVLAGNVIVVDGISSAADVEGVTIRDSMIGGGGLSGIYIDKATNVQLNGITSTGSSFAVPNGFNNIFVGPNALGAFSLTNSRIVNDVQNGSTGQCAYGVFLNTGALTGGTVVVFGNRLQGSTGGLLDGSAPTGSAKLVASNMTV